MWNVEDGRCLKTNPKAFNGVPTNLQARTQTHTFYFELPINCRARADPLCSLSLFSVLLFFFIPSFFSFFFFSFLFLLFLPKLTPDGETVICTGTSSEIKLIDTTTLEVVLFFLERLIPNVFFILLCLSFSLLGCANTAAS